jgi:MazG family protein
MKDKLATLGDPRALHLRERREADDTLGRALALVRLLRDRCPWDKKQTAQSLRPYLLEEAHEVAESISVGDDTSLQKELGDLLLNVAFQIILAEERGAFSTQDVIAALEEKMVARHPHVFGDSKSPPDWEAMKAAERRSEAALQNEAEKTGPEPFEGISPGLDPLSRAARVQERMATFGFDWESVEGALAKVREEIVELQQVADTNSAFHIGDANAAVEEEAGDLLFAAANTARLAGVHPANALLVSVSKFEDRCRRMIKLAEMRGTDWETVGLETLDRLWDEIKQEES